MKEKSRVLMTGDRPSGPLHLGHYVGSLKNRLLLQDQYESYIMVADMQALTDHFEQPEKVKHAIYEVVKDYLAVGLDPEKVIIFIQSQVPELAELTCYYMNLVTLGRLERNPTVKAEIQQKNMASHLSVGFFCYPISQAADMTIFGDSRGKVLIPVGEDQLPMIELCNEIVKKFNRLYHTNCLQEVKAYLSSTARLVGIDGQHKASKTLNNAIFLKDAPEVVKEKVFSMFTDPNHIRVSDPGKVEGNVVFSYLSCFHQNAEEIEDLKKQYRRGGLADMALKNMLNQDLQAFLKPIHERRAQYTQNHIQDVIREGTRRARAKAQDMMHKIRHAIQLAEL